jgi:hypothetical protein
MQKMRSARSLAKNRNYSLGITEEVDMGRGLLLWLLGIPIPVIILLYLFHVV